MYLFFNSESKNLVSELHVKLRSRGNMCTHSSQIDFALFDKTWLSNRLHLLFVVPSLSPLSDSMRILHTGRTYLLAYIMKFVYLRCVQALSIDNTVEYLYTLK